MTVRKTSFTVKSMLGNGAAALGSVLAYLPDIHASAFQPPALGAVKNGLMRCQGNASQRTIPSGPMSGALIPDLSDERFLHGSTVSWSNPNDADANYRSQPSYPNSVTLSYTGTSALRTAVFSPGNFTPAQSPTSPAPAPHTQPVGTVDLTHTHTFDHTHGSGTLLGLGRYATGVVQLSSPGGGSWTATRQGTTPNGAWTPASTAATFATDILGFASPAGATSGSSDIADATAPHSHSLTGTAVPIPATFAATGSFTPDGVVSGYTDRRPKYLSAIYLIRVS